MQELKHIIFQDLLNEPRTEKKSCFLRMDVKSDNHDKGLKSICFLEKWLLFTFLLQFNPA